MGSPGANKVLFEPSEHLWQVWGLILNAIFPLLLSCCGFTFAFGGGVSFFDGIQHSLVDGCSAASCNFGVLTWEDEHTSFYSAILQYISPSVGLLQCRGSGCSRLGYGISLFEEVTINSTIDPPELTQGWGNRHLEGTNKTLCAPGPRGREQWFNKRLIQICPWVSRSFQQRCGSAVACCRVGVTEYGTVCLRLFEGERHSLH